MATYYNENDPFAAAWLRELIKDGLIAPGDVDERSIEEVEPADLKGYIQCHFFAGIGVWSYALRNAGWPDDRPVWTGSCPCPPFSVAGKKKKCLRCKSADLVPCPRRTGFFLCCRCHHAWLADARHLWPEMWRLVSRGRPLCFFGEQVDGSDGEVWLASVRASLEILGYAVWPAGLPAAGFGAPHIRQRLYFVADTEHAQRRAFDLSGEDGRDRQNKGRAETHSQPGTRSEVRRLADAERGRRQQCDTGERGVQEPDAGCEAGELGDTSGARLAQRERHGGVQSEALEPQEGQAGECPGFTNGFWRDAIWLPCRDGKWRPAQSGIFPLAARTPNRVGTLRGAGNALCAPVAEAFVRAYMEVRAGIAEEKIRQWEREEISDGKR